jgi:type IV pilus assembly protein PilM
MFNLLQTKSVSAFGLDISDVSIKVMELAKKNKSLYPVAVSEAPLSSGVIVNHMIVNEAKLAENIKKAVLAARHVSTNYVVVSIPESKSFVRVLQMQKMPEEEITTSLPFEVEQNIPVPVDLVYMDWQILRTLPDSLEILVTATPRDYVDSLVSTLKVAGLKPMALELESQAMARSLVGGEYLKAGVLIVDISSMQTSFVVVEQGSLEYTSSMPIGGNAFTESVARNLNMALPDAEQAKIAQGLVADIKKGNIRQAILPLLDNIIDEVRNVMKFHEEHADNHTQISKIILCGGSSRLPGMSDYFSARMNLGSTRSVGQVVLGNPWINILDPSKEKLPITIEESLSYSTVAGLALRGVGGNVNS